MPKNRLKSTFDSGYRSGIPDANYIVFGPESSSPIADQIAYGQFKKIPRRQIIKKQATKFKGKSVKEVQQLERMDWNALLKTKNYYIEQGMPPIEISGKYERFNRLDSDKSFSVLHNILKKPIEISKSEDITLLTTSNVVKELNKISTIDLAKSDPHIKIYWKKDKSSKEFEVLNSYLYDHPILALKGGGLNQYLPDAIYQTRPIASIKNINIEHGLEAGAGFISIPKATIEIVVHNVSLLKYSGKDSILKRLMSPLTNFFVEVGRSSTTNDYLNYKATFDLVISHYSTVMNADGTMTLTIHGVNKAKRYSNLLSVGMPGEILEEYLKEQDDLIEEQQKKIKAKTENKPYTPPNVDQKQRNLLTNYRKNIKEYIKEINRIFGELIKSTKEFKTETGQDKFTTVGELINKFIAPMLEVLAKNNNGTSEIYVGNLNNLSGHIIFDRIKKNSEISLKDKIDKKQVFEFEAGKEEETNKKMQLGGAINIADLPINTKKLYQEFHNRMTKADCQPYTANEFFNLVFSGGSYLANPNLYNPEVNPFDKKTKKKKQLAGNKQKEQTQRLYSDKSKFIMPLIKAHLYITIGKQNRPAYCLFIFDQKRCSPGVQDLEKLAMAKFGKVSKENILKIVEEKHIPVLTFGRSDSIVKDLQISTELNDEFATVMITRALRIENSQSDKRKERELGLKEKQKEKRLPLQEESAPVTKYYHRGSVNGIGSFLWQPPGCFFLDAGSSYQCLDNFFFITKVTHNVSNSGHVSTLEIMVNY